MSETKALQDSQIAEAGAFAITAAQDMDAIMDEDLAGLEFTPDRIKIPTGGNTTFEVPDGDTDEGTRPAKEIVGVIILHHPAYAYYRDRYTGGNNPPDCGSFDGIHGRGTPGGECRECPFNQFGSGEGAGKACKNRRMLYILMEGEIFPMVLSLPTGSLKEFAKYVKHQLTKGRRLSQIVTKISLKRAVNANGIAFSQAVFSFVRTLDPVEAESMAGIAAQARQYAAGLTLASLSGEEDPPEEDPETGRPVQPLK